MSVKANRNTCRAKSRPASSDGSRLSRSTLNDRCLADILGRSHSPRADDRYRSSSAGEDVSAQYFGKLTDLYVTR
jgi:hypothetical protein